MKRKEEGSITVFLSIIFLLFFAMLGVTFENVRSLISTGYVRTAAYSAAITAFGDYNKELYQDYGLFGYGGAEGKNSSDLESAYNRILYENLSATPVNADGSYVDLFMYKDITVAIQNTKYITNSDEFAGQIKAFLKHEAVLELKDHLMQKTQGAKKEEMQNKLAMTKEYEQGRYDPSDDDKKEKKDIEKNTEEESGKEQQSKEDAGTGQEEAKSQKDAAGGNPLSFFTELARDGVLKLVCDEEKLTDNVILSCQDDYNAERQKTADKKPGSIRKEEQKSNAGEILADFIGKNHDETENVSGSPDKITMISYANKVFSSYANEQNTTTKYGLEYLAAGKSNEKDNLAFVINRLLAIRLLLNFTYVVKNAEFQEKSLATATAIAGITGLPPVVNAVQYTILLILAFEEACVDVRALLIGKKLPVLKKASDFQMKYEEICMGSKSLFDKKANHYQENGEKSGMSYQQYLWSFLLMVSQNTIEMRAFDLIEYDLREKYNQTFCIHSCICRCSYQISYQVPVIFQNLPFLDQSLFKTNNSYKSLEVDYGYKSK